MTKPKLVPRDYWETPEEVIKIIEAHTGKDVTIDLCATPDNAKHAKYITEENDLFTICPTSFTDEICWMNPPFSSGNLNVFAKYATRVAEAGGTVYFMCPADPSVGYFHSTLIKSAVEVVSFETRIGYIPPAGVKKSSPRGPTWCVILQGTPDPSRVSVPLTVVPSRLNRMKTKPVS